jgi:hypothetical protein
VTIEAGPDAAEALRTAIASSRADARIELGAGRFVLPSPIALERGITLVGKWGLTILDGQAQHGLLLLGGKGQTYRFENITLEKGASEWGGAVQSPNANEIVFDGCRFAENQSTKNGAAAYLEQTKGSFSRCVFAHNKAGGGGALALGRKCDVTIDRCVFTRNEADVGGALFLSDSAALVGKSITVVENKATRPKGGHALFVLGTTGYGPTAHFSNCIFADEGAFGADPTKKAKVYFTSSILPWSVLGQASFEQVGENTVGTPALIGVGPDLFALSPGARGAGTADATRIERGAVDLLGRPLVREGHADPGAIARP